MRKISVFVGLGLIATAIQWGLPTFTRAAEDFKPVTLKYGSPEPSSSWLSENHQWWANEVEKRTGGKVKIKIFFMGSLFKVTESLVAVQSGMGDLAWINSTYFPSNLPLFLVLDSPLNIRRDYLAAVRALVDTMENEPNLKAELERENIVPVATHISGQMYLLSKKCFNLGPGIKGQTIRTIGGARAKYYQNLGANPVFMPYPDIYEAIDRGTISGFEGTLVLSQGFKHYEVAKCAQMMESGGSLAGGIFMNRKVFNSFPRDIQNTLFDLRKDYTTRMVRRLVDDETQISREWETKRGVTIRNLTAEDQKLSDEAGRKAVEFTIKKQESDGHAAAGKVWNYYQNALKTYENQGTQEKKK